MLIYYVYAYIRKDGTPYYIGKGKDGRAYEKHASIQRPVRSRIILLETNLTEVGSLAIERRLIRWWGRKDIGTGILRNRTDGGDGGSFPGKSNPMFGKPRTDEVKRKLSVANTGKVMPQETREKISVTLTGRTHTDEQKKGMSDKQLAAGGYGPKKHSEATKARIKEKITGMKRSEETKAKMRAAALLREERKRAQVDS